MTDEIAIITGAAGGIGAATARLLAATGYAVGLLDLDTSRTAPLATEIAAGGGSAAAVGMNVCDPDSVEAGLDAVEERLGPVTAVVASAGIIHKAPYLELEPEAWRATLEVNLTGTWLVLQRVARRMVAGGRPGAMVAISSISGRSGRATSADYAASKAGVISLVRSSALALAEHGIRVNAVCPGIVETPMTRAIHEQTGQELGISPEASIERMLEMVPLGRIETAAEVADAIAFLLSPAARYITGQTLNVDGGVEMD